MEFSPEKNAQKNTLGVSVESVLGAAVELGILTHCKGVIHPKDHLIYYIITHSQRALAAGDEAYRVGVGEYFENGGKDALQIAKVMDLLGHKDSASVLEFASGYGRMTRHFKLPRFTAADIHEEAVIFLREQLGVNALLSTMDPADFNPPQRFDFIFALSLFSHLSDSLFGPWIGKLYSLLRPGGHLLFTTYGPAGARENPHLVEHLLQPGEFRFVDHHTDQPDLDMKSYATMIATPEYVIRQITRNTLGHIVSTTPTCWWNSQDEWIVAAPSRVRRMARKVRRWAAPS